MLKKPEFPAAIQKIVEAYVPECLIERITDEHQALVVRRTCVRQLSDLEPALKIVSAVWVCDGAQLVLRGSFFGAFQGNPNLRFIRGAIDTRAVTNMRRMFKDAHRFEGGICNWVTDNVRDTSEMLMRCGKFADELQWDLRRARWVHYMCYAAGRRFFINAERRLAPCEQIPNHR